MQKLKSKSVMLVMLCGILASCFSPPKLDPDQAENRAMFVVQELDSSSSLRINQESSSSLPESFTLTLKACLVSAASPDTALYNTEYLLSLEEDLLNDEFEKYKKGDSKCDRREKKENFFYRLLGWGKKEKVSESKSKKDNPCLSGSKLSAMAGKENKIINVRVDDGCIKWNEDYNYVYVTESQWIKTTRYIRSLSPRFPGGFPIDLVINPWLQKIDEQGYGGFKVRDFRFDREKKDEALKVKYNMPGFDFLKTAKKVESSEKANIMVDNIILHISDVQSIPHRKDKSTNQPVLRKILKGKIEAPLQYSIKSINGKYQHNDITTGDFAVELNLLTRINTDEKNSENMRRINITPQQNDIQNVTNQPKVNFEADTESKTPKLKSETFQWVYEYKTTNQPVYLHFKLFPRGETAKRVKPFEGIYSISLKSFHNITDSLSQKIYLEDSLRGKYINLLNSYHADLSRELGAEEKKHNKKDKKTAASSRRSPLKTAAVLFEKRKKGPQTFIDCVRTKKNGNKECGLKGLSPQDSGATGVSWPISRLFFRHNSVVKEHWLSRKIKTVVEGSLKDSNNMALPGQKINIEITDFTTGEISKIENVTTKEDGIFSFNIFTKQHWYKRQRYFLKKLRFYYGEQMNVTRLVMINPWDYGFTHGFEIEGPTYNRTTCLKETRAEKQSLKTLLKDLNTPFLLRADNQTAEALKAKSLIQNLFCYDSSLRDFYGMPKDKSSSFLDLSALFIQFKHLLQQVFDQEGMVKGLDQMDKEKKKAEFLYTKFETSKKAHPASLYIHLLRSITTFPDYTIDNSLNRDLRYNMSFKLTPRVVRHDDLARGQQNKGPLRDGIYIFQLAVLKNRQERVRGDYAMVKKVDFNKTASVPLGHTTSLCEGDLHSCLNSVDFILPPVNVPVLVRDGMVRTEFKLPLTQEQLLFSDSKNVMVFRIVPADPTSVICKDGTSQCAITGSEARSGYANSAYLAGMDWEKSAASLKAIDLKNNPYSDMVISTWRAPFILSRWANWTITSETRENFDQLSYRYFLEEQKHLIDHFYTHTMEKLNFQLEEANSSIPPAVKNPGDLPPSQLADKKAEQIQSFIRNLQRQKQKKTDEIDNLFVEAFGSVDTNNKEETQKFSEEMEDLSASSSLSDAGASLVKLKNIRIVEPDILNQIKKRVKNQSFLNKGCASVNTDGRVYRIPLLSQREGLGSACSGAKVESENRGAFHTALLASENGLCILNVDSQKASSYFPINEEGRIRQCRKNHSDFMTHINEQVALIHAKKNTTYPISFPGMAPTGFSGYMIPGYSAFDYSYRLDVGKSLVQGDKDIATLSNEDVESIIIRGVRPKTFLTDSKTQAFTQALCGFWFDKFYSSYMTPQGLIDGFRKKARTDIYYQMRGLTDPAGYKGLVAQWEEGKGDHEDSSSFLKEDLKEGMESVKEALDLFQREQDQSGQLWNIYDWISGRRGARGSLSHRLENHLTSQVGKTPFKGVSSFGWVPDGQPPPPILENLPGSHPVLKCLKNPSHFFAFENKIVVGEISDSSKIHRYKTGVPQTFRVSENFFMNTQRDQGANQGSETNVGFNTSVAVMPALTTLAYAALYKKAGLLAAATIGGAAAGGPLAVGVGAGLLLATLSAQPLVGHNYAYRGYEGTGARRLISFVVEQGVNLRAEESRIQLGLKNYRHCLVVRPRFSAFGFKTASRVNPYRHIWKESIDPYLRSLYAKSGMLLCTSGRQPDKMIEEHYYYISPDYTAQDGRSQDPASFRNKPFAINIRGKEAFHKFKEDISCYMADAPEHELLGVSCRDTKRRFKYLLNQRFEFSDSLRKGFNFPKTFHSTGSVPGVYALDKWPGGVSLKEGEDVKPEEFLKRLGEWGPDADLTKYLKKSFISPEN